jgi:hypothetical protein
MHIEELRRRTWPGNCMHFGRTQLEVGRSPAPASTGGHINCLSNNISDPGKPRLAVTVPKVPAAVPGAPCALQGFWFGVCSITLSGRGTP